MFIEWRKVKNKFYPYVRWSTWNSELKKGETKSVYLGANLQKAEQKLIAIVQNLQNEHKFNPEKIDLMMLLNSLRDKSPKQPGKSADYQKKQEKLTVMELAAAIDNNDDNQSSLSESETHQSLPTIMPDKTLNNNNNPVTDKNFYIELCNPNIFWSKNLTSLNLGNEEDRNRIINCSFIFDTVLSQSK